MAAGWQFRRSHAAANSTSHRCVCEFKIAIDTPKQKPAAAHVASADEFLREKKLLIKDREQHMNILRTRDASQQNGLTATPERGGDPLRVTLKGYAELLRGKIDLGLGEPREIVEMHTG